MSQNLQNGVGYYNKEKQSITKYNLYKNENNGFLLSSSGSPPEGVVSHGTAALPEVGSDSSVVGNPEQEISLSQEMIERALIQFFDNGEQSFQRYKVKIRLNLRDKTNPEFIASLSKDIRNFRKYIPEECKEYILDIAKQTRKSIKEKFGVYPYIGKFHLNGGQTGKRYKVSNQIEPWTFVAVWYDSNEAGWSGLLQMYEWAYQFDLFDNNVTAKQRAVGVKSSMLFINPLYDARVRPQTWAEKRRKEIK